MQGGYLLGNNAYQKSKNSRDEQQRTHVGETPRAEIGVGVIHDPGHKEAGANWQKKPLR